MGDHNSRLKRAPRELWLYQNCTDNKYGPLVQERQILEMIVLGYPLPGTLNNLCTLIDIEIGNVVSLVSLLDEREYHFCPDAQTAMQVGLYVFSSTNIISRNKALLGTLEIYSCDSRRPTIRENQLIERVAHLAAIAIQRHKDTEDSTRSSRHSTGAMDDSAREKPPFIN